MVNGTVDGDRTRFKLIFFGNEASPPIGRGNERHTQSSGENTTDHGEYPVLLELIW